MDPHPEAPFAPAKGLEGCSRGPGAAGRLHLRWNVLRGPFGAPQDEGGGLLKQALRGRNHTRILNEEHDVRCVDDDGVILRQNSAGLFITTKPALKMLDKAHGDDFGDDLLGVADALAAFGSAGRRRAPRRGLN